MVFKLVILLLLLLLLLLLHLFGGVLPRPLQATHAYFGFPISRQERRE